MSRQSYFQFHTWAWDKDIRGSWETTFLSVSKFQGNKELDSLTKKFSSHVLPRVLIHFGPTKTEL